MFLRFSVTAQLLLGAGLMYLVYHIGTLVPHKRPTIRIEQYKTEEESVASIYSPVDNAPVEHSNNDPADKVDEAPVPPNWDSTWVDAAVARARVNIAKTLESYPFTDGVTSDDLIYEKGGNPIKAMIATTWRSGSTFLGDILLAHPATWYHYEPLLHFHIQQVRSGGLAERAQTILRQIMKCDYSNLDGYFAYGKQHHELFRHNVRYWKYCSGKGRSYCWQPRFTEAMCKLYPFQSLKTVRMRLNLTREYLEDDSLNVKLVLLVRDPRGTLQSRLHRTWCPNKPDCDQPARLCADLVSDYKTAQVLMKQFPDKFMVYRYEDFSADPPANAARVLQFYGLAMHPQVQTFITSHTKNKIGGVSSTFRDSSKAPYHWKHDLPFQRILEIQRECSEALQLWGYYPYQSEDELDKVHPVLNYTLESPQNVP